MAERNNDPFFGRGETFYGAGGTPVSTDYHWLPGMEYIFEDKAGSGVAGGRSGKRVRVRVVKNVSGIALLGKRLVTFKTSAAGDQGFETEIDGYVATDYVRAYALDEYLPSGGLPNNDLGFIVVEGPAIVSTCTAADATNVISVGDFIHAKTAANSTTTASTHPSGRVQLADFTGATSVLALKIKNTIGRALSAATTANTLSDLLINVGGQ